MVYLKRNNEIIHFIFCFLTLFLQVFGHEEEFFGVKNSNFTLEDIENIKISPMEYQCPKESSFFTELEFETREGEKFKSCDYQYLCNKKNEKCIILNASMGLDSYTYRNGQTYGKAFQTFESGGTKNLILIGCNENRLNKEACKTDICQNNEDCFSDKCVDGICMSNKENPITLCRPVKENSEIKVKCLASIEEECKEDKDCALNAKCTKNKVCAEAEVDDSSSSSIIKYVLIGLAILLLVILIVALLFKSKKKEGK